MVFMTRLRRPIGKDCVPYDSAVARGRTGGLAWIITSAGVPIAGGFAASQFLAWGLREPAGTWQVFLFIFAGVSLAAAIAVTVITKVAEHRRSATIATAQRDQLIALRDKLMPLAATTADMALQPQQDRGPYLRTVAAVAASALSTLVADHVDRARAVVYQLNVDREPVRLESIGHSGRGDRPRPFEEGTARGDGALDFIAKRQTAHYPDLAKEKPQGYEGSMSGYRTFISVPIWTEEGVYGMVTLDAAKATSFDEGDVALTELVAEIMSIPFEVGQDDDSPDVVPVVPSM